LKIQETELIGMTLVPRSVMEDITVLIPTLGREMLQGCLQSIAIGNDWPANLIVVDQGSNPRIEGWLRALRSMGMCTEYVPSSQKGVAAARNRGIERVRTRFVVITDDDCIVEPHWLYKMATHLRQNPHAILTGQVKPGGDGVVVSVKTSPMPRIYTRPLLKGDVLFPGNMGCATKLFERVGLFDESDFLRSAEDNDWSYRALRMGIRIIYAPDVIVKHLDWRNESQLTATYRAYAFSQGGFYGKHLRRGDLFIAFRIVIAHLRGIRRWLNGIMTSSSELKISGRAFMTELLPGIIAGIRGKR
jgi:GT2 family glycosyltransferase